jgi:hypothetical protein
MPEFETEEFKFPDEKEEVSVTFDKKDEDDFEIEIEDDTPPEDRGRDPLPAPLKEELEKDDLEVYDDEVKQKLKQMRKVYHDERREKEAALREHQEAIRLAQQYMSENQRMRQILDQGGKEYAQTLQTAANLQLEAARRAYKEAYDSGDSDSILAAQEKLNDATMRMRQAESFQMPTLQQENYVVQNAPQAPSPQPNNPKLQQWLDRNIWYGQDDEMTAAALGLHEKLKKSGEVAVGSDEYYAILDKTIRRRFPEHFHQEEQGSQARTETRTKPSTVVAPAVRSTSPKRIKLKASQVNLAKRLGLTPEQYAHEQRKLEAQNG